jgi:DNA-binding CsgD family transcriptional regulator
MINSISGISATVPNAAAQAAVQPAATQPAPKPATVPQKADTVELSKAAQIRSLKRGGQTVAQIAVSMGLDAKTVNSYLGTAPAKLPTVQAAQAKQASAPAPKAAEESTESSAAKMSETILGK